MSQKNTHLMPDENAFQNNLTRRKRIGFFSQALFILAIAIGVLSLVALFLNIANDAVGAVAIHYTVDPASLTDGLPPESLHTLSDEALIDILVTHSSSRLRVYIRDYLSVLPTDQFSAGTTREIMGAGLLLPAGTDDTLLKALSSHQQAQLIVTHMDKQALEELIIHDIIQPRIVKSWPLNRSLFDWDGIQAEYAALASHKPDKYAGAELTRFHLWLSPDFVSAPMSSRPELAGIRTAILGTLNLMLYVIIFSLPVGLGTAIYLEEYAEKNRFTELIETNIRNLAGVPSIIYGILGLAIFVRALEPLTSGALFGVLDSNGRTLLSAGLTLSLLVLPLIIINAQEALRSVPWTLREASFGLGATRWQTIWRVTLPAAIPGIMTGAILSISRAIGETAPLIVVGASTFILTDPTGPFSKFTVVPMLIYDWTSRPQDEFRHLAAAAIVILLLLMLTFNAIAIILRNRYKIQY